MRAQEWKHARARVGGRSQRPVRLQNLLQARNQSAFDARWEKIPHADHHESADTLNIVNPGNGSLGNDIGRLAYLCDAHPRCVTFNSNGWLKSNATVDHSGPTCSSDLYVRLDA